MRSLGILNRLAKESAIYGISTAMGRFVHLLIAPVLTRIFSPEDYGVIAQEIEEILPELVQTREDGYKAVKYDKLVSLLIEGIKHLNNEVNELKGRLNNGSNN